MSQPLIKICGLRDTGMIDTAIRAGATHVGLVFFARSPRNVSIEQAAALADYARGRVSIVALLVDPDMDMAAHVNAAVQPDVIQLHGGESPAQAGAIRAATGREVWKAIGVRKTADLEAGRAYAGSVERLLYDAKPPEGAPLPGGTGLRIDWGLMRGFAHPLRWVLAGGLDPRNVAEAMAITGADAVDVSSGVERAPGVKDAALIAQFCAAARG
ncbi:MAG TPA: phosphoribosylanthranilate isomerase [Novosphingobium sp.]|nr:phosphoribosylanthranilate isomerase [Novosphingobium sp.]